MHQFRNNKLPISFSNTFADIISTDILQTRHNGYNYGNIPAEKTYLEKFPYKKIINDWNFLNIDLKSTAEEIEFHQLLKEKYLSTYSCDVECIRPCIRCG